MRIGKRKLKWQAYVLLVIIVLAVAIPIVLNNIKKHNSLEYKLETIGYNNSDIEKIKNLNDEAIEFILNNKHNNFYIDLMNYKYYINDNFMDYLKYHDEMEEYDIEHLVAYVNTASYKEPYEDVKEADTSKGYLTLVNKYNYLPKTYKPKNLKNVSNWYAYEGRKLEDKAYEAFIAMFNSAKDDGVNIVLYRGFRSYEDQEDIFNTYKSDYGERQADTMTTRAGYSEYQTGLSLVIVNYYGGDVDFKGTKEYAWLKDNAHKFGFILRYPEGKEYITKYDFEAEHFRYVGIEEATIMYNENLTLEEYNAFYLK